MALAARSVAESKTSFAVDASALRLFTLPSTAVQRIDSIIDWGAVSVPMQTLTPRLRYSG